MEDSVWSASDAAATGMTLSNGGLTVQGPPTNGWQLTRNTVSRSSGNVYVEFLVGAGQSSGYIQYSLVSASVSATDPQRANYSGFMWPIDGSSNVVSSGFVNNYNLVGTAAIGDVIALAVNFSSGSVWIARNNIWLHGSNPVTGTLPVLSFTPETVGPLFVGASPYNNNSGLVTIQSAATSQKYAPPLGFIAWDTPQPITIYLDKPVSVWNAQDAAMQPVPVAISNGGLTRTIQGTTGWQTTRSTVSRSAGKYYIEWFTPSGSAQSYFGIAGADFVPGTNIPLGNAPTSLGLSVGGIGCACNPPAAWVWPDIDYANNIVANDVFAIAADLDTGKFWLARNNVWVVGGDPATGLKPYAYVPAIIRLLTTDDSGPSQLPSLGDGAEVAPLPDADDPLRDAVVEALAVIGMPFFPAISSVYGSETFILQATAASQTYAPPAGFEPWDGDASLTWTVPPNWNSNDNSVECIGGGGGGGNSIGNAGSGGEGGHYAKSINLTLTPGSIVNVRVGVGGLGAVAYPSNAFPGVETWFGGTSLATSLCGAIGGAGGVGSDTYGGVDTTTPTTGDVGSVVFQGGAGAGYSRGGNQYPGLGGGGAAGPGGAGGRAGQIGSIMGAGGGGGAGNTGGPGQEGGPSDSQNLGVPPWYGGLGGAAGDGTPGGAGGYDDGGANAGLPNKSAEPGSRGSGAGGAVQKEPGATGGAGADIAWDEHHGPGGGGGGGGGNTAFNGGDGGLYGGGGGSSGCWWAAPIHGGKGAQGLIVIQYMPVPIDAVGELDSTIDFAGHINADFAVAGDLSPFVDLAGRLSYIAPLAGDIAYQVSLAGTAVSFQIDLEGGYGTTVAFAGDQIHTSTDIKGDLAPEIDFAANITLTRVLAGDMAAQVALGASLTANLVMQGFLPTQVTFAASGLVAGPLWADTAPPAPVSWNPSELCNG
jgi:hypothetical protein